MTRERRIAADAADAPAAAASNGGGETRGGWASELGSRLASSYHAHRGWAGVSLPPLGEVWDAWEALPPTALVLVVHGVGESLWASKSRKLPVPSLEESVERMRGAAAKGAYQAGRKSRVELLPVTWYNGLRVDNSATLRALAAVTPRSVPALRTFANEVVLDVLFYEQPAHRELIQRAVATQVAAILKAWYHHHPTWPAEKRQVVLCGHSLGAVICFDMLLSSSPPPAPALPCSPGHRRTESSSAPAPAANAWSPEPTAVTRPPTAAAAPPAAAPIAAVAAPPETWEPGVLPPGAFSAFVALGSPVGMFAALRGLHLGPAFALPGCPGFFNVFHRNDPVAYRLEPLLGSPEFAADAAESAPPPAYVPFAGDKSGLRTHVKLRNTLQDVKKMSTTIMSWASAGIDGAAAAVSAVAMKATGGATPAAVLSGLEQSTPRAAAAAARPRRRRRRRRRAPPRSTAARGWTGCCRRRRSRWPTSAASASTFRRCRPTRRTSSRETWRRSS